MRAHVKKEVVTALKDRFERASIMILTEPSGLTVAEVTDLRKKIRGQDGEYKIAKNTLAVRAVDETPFAELTPMLKGQTALVFGYGDPVGVTKELVNATKDLEKKLQIRGAVMDGALLSEQDVAALAKLGSMEELRGKLVGLLAAPGSQLVRLLAQPAGGLARVIQARGENGAPADG